MTGPSITSIGCMSGDCLAPATGSMRTGPSLFYSKTSIDFVLTKRDPGVMQKMFQRVTVANAISLSVWVRPSAAVVDFASYILYQPNLFQILYLPGGLYPAQVCTPYSAPLDFTSAAFD